MYSHGFHKLNKFNSFFVLLPYCKQKEPTGVQEKKNAKLSPKVHVRNGTLLKIKKGKNVLFFRFQLHRFQNFAQKLKKLSGDITITNPPLITTPPSSKLRREAPENFLLRKSLIKKFFYNYPPPHFCKNRRKGGGSYSDIP